MRKIVKDAPHRSDIAGNTRCRLIVADEHTLDGVGAIGFEPAAIFRKRHALAPGHLDNVDIKTKALAEIDPEMGELAERCRQYLVARRKGVGDGRFPAAGARGRKDHHLTALSAKHLLEVGENWPHELRKIGGAMVLKRAVHGHAHLIGHIGGAGNGENSVAAGHRSLSCRWSLSCRLRSCQSLLLITGLLLAGRSHPALAALIPLPQRL